MERGRSHLQQREPASGLRLGPPLAEPAAATPGAGASAAALRLAPAVSAGFRRPWLGKCALQILLGAQLRKADHHTPPMVRRRAVPNP